METFKKRQKEMRRLERQRDKAARRIERKQNRATSGGDTSLDDTPSNDAPAAAPDSAPTAEPATDDIARPL
jgi:hypothetical protein